MNVNQTSPIDTANPPPSPAGWTRLRQRRQTPPRKTGEIAADKPFAPAGELGATMPSWPRIFPGL